MRRMRFRVQFAARLLPTACLLALLFGWCLAGVGAYKVCGNYTDPDVIAHSDCKRELRFIACVFIALAVGDRTVALIVQRAQDVARWTTAPRTSTTTKAMSMRTGLVMFVTQTLMVTAWSMGWTTAPSHSTPCRRTPRVWAVALLAHWAPLSNPSWWVVV